MFVLTGLIFGIISYPLTSIWTKKVHSGTNLCHILGNHIETCVIIIFDSMVIQP